VDEKGYDFETYDWLWKKIDTLCMGRFVLRELVFPFSRE
jgi:hypothetical protein